MKSSIFKAGWGRLLLFCSGLYFSMTFWTPLDQAYAQKVSKQIVSSSQTIKEIKIQNTFLGKMPRGLQKFFSRTEPLNSKERASDLIVEAQNEFIFANPDLSLLRKFYKKILDSPLTTFDRARLESILNSTAPYSAMFDPQVKYKSLLSLTKVNVKGQLEKTDPPSWEESQTFLSYVSLKILEKKYGNIYSQFPYLLKFRILVEIRFYPSDVQDSLRSYIKLHPKQAFTQKAKSLLASYGLTKPQNLEDPM